MEKYYLYDTEYRAFHSFDSKEEVLEFLNEAAIESTMQQFEIIRGTELSLALSINIEEKK